MRGKRIAVVGGGIYGITIASVLSASNKVTLFEKNDDILSAASGINQFRLHRGYHYPRSPKTVISSLKSEKSFAQEYRPAIMANTENYYCIAKEKSKTSQKKYLKFLGKFKLEYKVEEIPSLEVRNVDLSIRVKEYLLNPLILKKKCWAKLKKSKVKVLLKTEASDRVFDDFDHVIICTYADINRLLKKFPKHQQVYQYELCEKIVVRLPKEFKNKSIVVLDGPFMCVDPYGTTNLFLMGNVDHAIHEANIGKFPVIINKYHKLLNKGVIKDPPITNFKKFIDSTEHFIPLITKAKHVGSMYTIRTVLPYKDKTDERPTIVRRINRKIFTVFSGKIANCVEAAEKIKKII